MRSLVARCCQRTRAAQPAEADLGGLASFVRKVRGSFARQLLYGRAQVLYSGPGASQQTSATTEAPQRFRRVSRPTWFSVCSVLSNMVH